MIVRLKNIYKFLLRQDKALYKGFASVTLLRIVERLSGLVLSIFLFRFLTKEEVASYGYIQTIVAICAVLSIQEMQNVVSQSVSRGHGGTYRAFTPVSFVSSIAGSLVLSVFSFWYFLSGQTDMALGFLAATFLFPFYQGLRLWRGVYLGQKKFSLFAKAESFNAIVKVGVIVACLFLFPHEIVFPIIVFFLIPSFQNIWRTKVVSKEISQDSPVEEGSLRYSFRASVYSAANIIAENIDRLVLYAFLSPAAVAIYMAAEKFSLLVQAAVQDIAAVLAPKFAAIDRYSHDLDKKMKILSFILGAGIILFALIVIPVIIPLVFGSSYHDSIIYSQILVCAAAVRNIATLRFRFIRSKIDEKSFRQVTVYSALAHIAASLILIPVFGLYGAVAAVFLHRTVLSFIVGRVIKTRYLSHER